MKKNDVYLGIDLGGTKIALGLVSAKGKLLSLNKKSTLIAGQHPTGHELVEKLVEAVIEQLELARAMKLKVGGLGLASTGPMNILTGELIEPANLRNIKRFALCAKLQSALKKRKVNLPLSFQNDAMAAAFAEAWMGASQKAQCSVMITVGTGIGSGVLKKNAESEPEALQNFGQGSEWGHSLIGSQTVEDLAAGPAILARAGRYFGKNFSTWSQLEAEITQRGELTPEESAVLFEPTADAVASLCYNLSIGLSPEVICFAGGVMNSKKYFWKPLQEKYKKLMTPFPEMVASLKLSQVKEPGVIGAAWMAQAKKYRVSI
jgi:glucokinase